MICKTGRTKRLGLPFWAPIPPKNLSTVTSELGLSSNYCSARVEVGLYWIRYPSLERKGLVNFPPIFLLPGLYGQELLPSRPLYSESSAFFWTPLTSTTLETRFGLPISRWAHQQQRTQCSFWAQFCGQSCPSYSCAEKKDRLGNFRSPTTSMSEWIQTRSIQMVGSNVPSRSNSSLWQSTPESEEKLRWVKIGFLTKSWTEQKRIPLLHHEPSDDQDEQWG